MHRDGRARMLRVDARGDTGARSEHPALLLAPGLLRLDGHSDM